MSSVGSWFQGIFASGSTELPDIFPMAISSKQFVEVDVQNIYTRILIDVIERTQGINDDQKALLWDNCLGSESQDGLVTMVAKAMRDRNDLFVVYDPALKLVRLATGPEQGQIKEDYKKAGESSVGVYITFKNYKRSELVAFYSGLEYCNVSGLFKAMNLSKALQLKMSDLRAAVGLSDKAEAKSQATSMAKGLSEGKDVLMDAKDQIVTAAPDLTAVNTAMAFIDQKRSFYLGMPSSYITGIRSSTMGDTGDADAKAVERGLKGYYFSIVKPALEAIFGVKTTFKSEDYRSVTTATAVLKDFELTSEEYMSKENKMSIINNLFGLPEDSEGDVAETDTALGAGAATTVAETAMNGAQVTSLVEVISKVVQKEIPGASARAILETAYLLSPADAAEMVNPAESFQAPKKEVQNVPAGI